MANETSGSGGKNWAEGMGIGTAAEGMRLGTRRILQNATSIGEQLSSHLAEAPLFVQDQMAPSRLKRMFEGWSKRITITSIMKLVLHRKAVKATLQEIPIRMQFVTNRVRLVLELIDDFAAGTYREIPWHSMALAAGAILYSVSPADIVPDVLPIIGSLDDLVVLGIALKVIDKDLRAYARSKGYDLNDFFPDPDSKVPPKAPAKAAATPSPASEAVETAAPEQT